MAGRAQGQSQKLERARPGPYGIPRLQCLVFRHMRHITAGILHQNMDRGSTSAGEILIGYKTSFGGGVEAPKFRCKHGLPFVIRRCWRTKLDEASWYVKLVCLGIGMHINMLIRSTNSDIQSSLQSALDSRRLAQSLQLACVTSCNFDWDQGLKARETNISGYLTIAHSLIPPVEFECYCNRTLSIQLIEAGSKMYTNITQQFFRFIKRCLLVS